MESDDQISDLTKTEINQIASKLNYSHPNTIRLRQLKSDLKEVADVIELIVSK